VIRTLWKHHPSRTMLAIKWLGMSASTLITWQGIFTYVLAKGHGVDPWLLALGSWFIPALILAVGPFEGRAREFSLTLPVSGQRLWQLHSGTLAYIGGFMLALSMGLQTLVIKLFAAASEPMPAMTEAAAYLDNLWLHGVAWWLILLAATVSDRPHLAAVARDRRWLLRQIVSVVVCGTGLILLGRIDGVLVPLAVAAVGAIWLHQTWRRVPGSLLLADHSLSSAPRRVTSDQLLRPLPWWRRRPFWLVVLLHTSKHPSMYIIAAPFLALVALWNTQWAPAQVGSEHLGFFYLGITAYMVFTMAASPVFRLASLDAWPVSRDRLLACFFVPQLLFMGLAYAGGEIMAYRDRGAGSEPLVFNAADHESPGLRMAAHYFHLTTGEPAAITAPDGSLIQPPGDWHVKGLPGVALYKPYYTPEGSNIDLVAWQLERASADIFDTAIPAAEFKERYLTVRADGTVATRGEAVLPLLADHPELRIQRFSGLAPLQVLIVGLLVQLGYATYLGFFRPHVSSRARKVAFGVGLGLYMALHIGQFVLDIADVIDIDSLAPATFALSDLAVAWAPGGAVGLWLMVIAILWPGHLLVRHRFRRAEFAPVREGDSFVDVLG